MNTDDQQDTQYDEGSLSSDLAAAFDAAETETTEQEAPNANTAETLPAAGEQPDGGDTGGERQPPADDQPVAGAESLETAQATDDTPPVSLPPAAREAWKDTPPAMREAIALREKQYNDGIVKYAADAKRAQQMDGVLSQYQHYFAMTGEPVGKTVNDLLRVASNLHMAPGNQKAQIVATLINQYGVPIDVLDSILAGESPRAPQQADMIDQRIQQAVQPFQQIIQSFQQREQQEQQRTQQQVATELQQFAAKNEFYADVSADMADFLDIAAMNGRNMTLDEAYQRACALNPQISQVLAARQKAPTSTQQRAASTLRPRGLGGPGATAEPNSLHDAISQAWDTVGRV